VGLSRSSCEDNPARIAKLIWSRAFTLASFQLGCRPAFEASIIFARLRSSGVKVDNSKIRPPKPGYKVRDKFSDATMAKFIYIKFSSVCFSCF
jgi:hypothetical protein